MPFLRGGAEEYEGHESVGLVGGPVEELVGETA